MISLVWLFPAGSIRADEVPFSSVSKNPASRLKEIVVTATRNDLPRMESAANIEVVTRDEIDRLPAATAAEVLRYVPGIYIEMSGGPGSCAVARIQGAEVRQVAVFRDGVPLNLLANPMTDLSLVAADSIERIEIYRGAASSAWGSALGGVINIITRSPAPEKPFAGELRSSYGEAETWKHHGLASGTAGRFGWLVSLDHDGSNGFVPHSRYTRRSLLAKTDYAFGPAGRISLVFSADKGNSDDPVINEPEFWDDAQQERIYQRIAVEARPGDDLGLIIEARHGHYDARIDDVYVDHREIFNDYAEESWGISVRGRYDAGGVNAVDAGFDGDWGNYDWYGYTDEYDTGNRALYIHDTATFGPYSVNAGLRYDDNRDFGAEISPSAGVVRRLPGGRGLIRAQIARGFSAPPPAWVHDPLYGNPDLDPEVAVNWQAGGEFPICGFMDVEINLFHADVNDLIHYDPAARRLENIDEVTRRGVETVLRAGFDFGLSLSFSASFTHVEDDSTGRAIKDIPTVLYRVSAAYTYKWMTNALFGNYVDHNSSYPETKDRVFVFDYRFDARLPEFAPVRPDIFCTVYNIFNTKYLYRDVWPQPDRWAEAGVRFEF